MPEHVVQFIVVREVIVDSPNDIQAEKDAYAKLSHHDQGAVIASVTLEDGHDGGCLKGGFGEGWAFAKKHCNSIDEEWLAGKDEVDLFDDLED